MLKGYVFVILSAMGFATLPIFLKIGYQLNITMDVLITLRFFIASIVLSILLFLTRKGKNVTNIKSQLPRLILQGLLYFGSAFCYTTAIRYLSASTTSILLYVYPTIVVMLMILFFHERIDVKKVIALAVTFIGCLMVINIFNTQIELNWVGILYGLGCATFYALYNVNGQYLSTKLDPIAISTYVTVVCTIATAIVFPPVSLINGKFIISYWLVGLGTAIVCTAAPLILYLRGLSRLGASKSAIVSTIEPLITIVLAWLFLGERLTQIQLFGGFFILLGVFILQIDNLFNKSQKSFGVNN